MVAAACKCGKRSGVVPGNVHNGQAVSSLVCVGYADRCGGCHAQTKRRTLSTNTLNHLWHAVDQKNAPLESVNFMGVSNESKMIFSGSDLESLDKIAFFSCDNPLLSHLRPHKTVNFIQQDPLRLE